MEVRTNIKMNQFDYNLVYETARVFAKRYSEEIEVQDKTQESVFFNGIEYPCVPLRLFVKGNASIYRELLHSGCCTKMDGCIENGKKAYRVLLWIEPDCASVHQVSSTGI